MRVNLCIVSGSVAYAKRILANATMLLIGVRSSCETVAVTCSSIFFFCFTDSSSFKHVRSTHFSKKNGNAPWFNGRRLTMHSVTIVEFTVWILIRCGLTYIVGF